MREQSPSIKLPPMEFASARRFTLLFLANIKSTRNYRVTRDEVVFEEKLTDVLINTFSSILDQYKTKTSAFGAQGPPCPKLRANINDFKWVGEKLSSVMEFKLEDTETVCSFFEKVVRTANALISRNKVDPHEQLGKVIVEGDKLVLGGDEAIAPQLQLLKLEKYEYGKSYLKIQSYKGDMKISPLWYAIIGAGWLTSYSGGTFDEMLILNPDSEALLSLIRTDPSMASMTIYEISYSAIKTKRRPTHTEAFTLLTLLLADQKTIEYLNRIPITMQRISFMEKQYSVIEEIPFYMASSLQKALALLSRQEYSLLRNVMIDLLDCTLREFSEKAQSSKYCSENWGGKTNMAQSTRAIWNIIMDIEPYKNLYILSRLSSSNKKTFRDEDVIKLAMKFIKEKSLIRYTD